MKKLIFQGNVLLLNCLRFQRAATSKMNRAVFVEGAAPELPKLPEQPKDPRAELMQLMEQMREMQAAKAATEHEANMIDARVNSLDSARASVGIPENDAEWQNLRTLRNKALEKNGDVYSPTHVQDVAAYYAAETEFQGRIIKTASAKALEGVKPDKEVAPEPEKPDKGKKPASEKPAEAKEKRKVTLAQDARNKLRTAADRYAAVHKAEWSPADQKDFDKKRLDSYQSEWMPGKTEADRTSARDVLRSFLVAQGWAPDKTVSDAEALEQGVPAPDVAPAAAPAAGELPPIAAVKPATPEAKETAEKPGYHEYPMGVYTGAKAVEGNISSVEGSVDATQHEKEAVNAEQWYKDKTDAAKALLAIVPTNQNRFDGATRLMIQPRIAILQEISAQTDFKPANFKAAVENKHSWAEMQDTYQILLAFQRAMDIHGGAEKLKQATSAITLSIGADLNSATDRFSKATVETGAKAPEALMDPTDKINQAQGFLNKRPINYMQSNYPNSLKDWFVLAGDTRLLVAMKDGSFYYTMSAEDRKNKIADWNYDKWETDYPGWKANPTTDAERNVNYRIAMGWADEAMDNMNKAGVKEIAGAQETPKPAPTASDKAPEKPAEVKGMIEELRGKGFEWVIEPSDWNQEGYAKLGEAKRVSIKFDQATKQYTYKLLTVSEGNPEVKSDTPVTPDAMKAALDATNAVDKVKAQYEDLIHLPGREVQAEKLEGKWKIDTVEGQYDLNTYKVTVKNCVVETDAKTHAKSAPFEATFNVTIKDDQYTGVLKTGGAPLDESSDVKVFVDDAVHAYYDDKEANK